MPFKTELIVKECPDGRWELVSDLTYLGSREEFTVPVGFVTDFASVPRIFHAIVPPTNPKYTKAAVLHDWLYSSQIISRKDADGLFLRMMRESGVRKTRRGVMWLAVRLFGWMPWKKK